MNHELNQLAQQSPLETWLQLPFTISVEIIKGYVLREVVDLSVNPVRRDVKHILANHEIAARLADGYDGDVILREYAMELDIKEDKMRRLASKISIGADDIILNLVANTSNSISRSLGLAMGLRIFMDRWFKDYKCVVDWDPWLDEVERYICRRLGEVRYNLIKSEINKDYE